MEHSPYIVHFRLLAIPSTIRRRPGQKDRNKGHFTILMTIESMNLPMFPFEVRHIISSKGEHVFSSFINKHRNVVLMCATGPWQICAGHAAK